jgi:hypothetical protein
MSGTTTPTLETLERAALSLGLTATRKGSDALDVRIRPLQVLRFRVTPAGIATGSWLAYLPMMALFAWLGFFLGSHRPNRLDNLTLFVVVGFGIALCEYIWGTLLALRTREKLFARAFELDRCKE